MFSSEFLVLITKIVAYGAIIILGFLGAFCMYIYIRYGKNRVGAVFVSIVFAGLFLSITQNIINYINTL